MNARTGRLEKLGKNVRSVLRKRAFAPRGIRKRRAWLETIL